MANKLITVFLDRPCGDLNYTKAIIDERAKDFFTNELGFESSPLDFEDKASRKVEAYVDSGTKGTGAIDSKEFIKASVLQQRSKKGVASLIFDRFKKRLSTDDKLVNIKAKAVAIIEERL